MSENENSCIPLVLLRRFQVAILIKCALTVLELDWYQHFEQEAQEAQEFEADRD